MTPLEIDLTEGAQSGLAAVEPLSLIDNGATFHTRHNLRPPLGIYNVSTSRVLQKVTDLCEKLEAYIGAGRNPEAGSGGKQAQALVDYIELAIYAAAEHVDDLEHIAKHFYRSERERNASKINKQFLKDLKVHKRFVAAVANYIKHSQNRIRLFELQFVHAGREGVFHGYVIESVVDGVVGPSPIFHSDARSIFSTTTLAWEIIAFVLNSSRELATFLTDKKRVEGPAQTQSKALVDAIVAAARLPLYQLDEDHPLESTPLRIVWDEDVGKRMESGLYGSVRSPWHASSSITFGGSHIAFSGDGITRTFKMLIQPRQVGLRHWS